MNFKIKINVTSVIEVMLVILILMIMSRSMITQLNILTGLPIFSNSIVQFTVLFLILVLIVTQMKANGKLKIGLLPSILTFTLLFIILSVPLVSQSSFSYPVEVRNLLFSYLLIISLGLARMVNLSFSNVSAIWKTVYLFIFCQAVLGILQALSRSPLVPTELNGESIVNSIYYLNGRSSSYAYFLDLGARVRAFGMTDSGLTLGMFSILGLCIPFQKAKGILGIISDLLFLLAIIFTYTRLIWLIAIIILLLKIAFKFTNFKDEFVKLVYYTNLGVSFCFLFFVLVGKLVTETTFFSTLISRFNGYYYFLNAFSYNLFSVLLGQNFLNRIPMFYTIYSLDNELLKVFGDIGIIGLLIVIVFFIEVLKETNFKKHIFIGVYLSLFPLMGIANSTLYFSSGLLLLVSTTLDDKFSLKREEKA